MWVEIDIDKAAMRGAKRGDSEDCPIAKRANRILAPEFRADVSVPLVGDETIGLNIYRRADETDAYLDGLEDSTPLPRIAAKWLEQYDNSPLGRPPAPITFRVSIRPRFLKQEKTAV